MMEVVVNLLAIGLAAVAVALAVARIRARRRLEESARGLMESHREFEKSIERLSRIVSSPKFAADSRKSTRPPLCGDNRDNRIETR